MSDEWQAGGTVLPQHTRLTSEQQEEVVQFLWRVGIPKDPFHMDPVARLRFLSETKFAAIATYAAIKHVMAGQVELIQTFPEWSRSLGLPW
jgi:hypothetical protein